MEKYLSLFHCTFVIYLVSLKSKSNFTIQLPFRMDFIDGKKQEKSCINYGGVKEATQGNVIKQWSSAFTLEFFRDFFLSSLHLLSLRKASEHVSMPSHSICVSRILFLFIDIDRLIVILSYNGENAFNRVGSVASTPNRLSWFQMSTIYFNIYPWDFVSVNSAKHRKLWNEKSL